MTRPNNERRLYPRHEMSCPARLVGEAGTLVATGRTINISDGGLLLPVRPQDRPPAGEIVDVKLSVPRSTPNTFLMQPFCSQAVVVRQEETPDGACHVAVRFDPPLDLDLEV